VRRRALHRNRLGPWPHPALSGTAGRRRLR
jgi:hypothetical protein